MNDDNDNDEHFVKKESEVGREGVRPDTEDGDDAEEEVKDSGCEVGYGKPPKSHRFAKGQSGNPKGRRGGTRNFRTYVREELEQKVSVKKDGRERTVPKVQLIAMQLVNMSVKGEIKSIEFLLKLADLMAVDEPEAAKQKPMSAQERQLLFNYIESLGLSEKDKKDEDDT